MLTEAKMDDDDEHVRADWRDFIAPTYGQQCEWGGCDETDPVNLTINIDREGGFVLCEKHRAMCLRGELMDETTVPSGSA